jgi:Carboxypeptidase regulatory-like domain
MLLVKHQARTISCASVLPTLVLPTLGMVVLCAAAAWAQALPESSPSASEASQGTAATVSTTDEATSAKPGSITGTVVDKDGAVIANAKISLAQDGVTPLREVRSGSDGQFVFTGVAPGAFHLTVAAPGFATREQSGDLQPGQEYLFPQIEMAVGAVVDVNVTVSPEIVAEEEIHEQEKQRVLGVVPNFYVSYVPDAMPLTTKQKFELGWKSSIDPISFGLAGVLAGLEQADNAFNGYGQGAQGYFKRFGATYADFTIGTFIGSVILPAVLKQDPRYFYKGIGSRKSRLGYALANAVICKGDNGRWQPNYSNMLGGLAAGGISNLYYPSANRNGVGLTFENALIAIGGSAATGVIQEFFIKKITPHVPGTQSAKN